MIGEVDLVVPIADVGEVCADCSASRVAAELGERQWEAGRRPLGGEVLGFFMGLLSWLEWQWLQWAHVGQTPSLFPSSAQN